MKKVKLLLILGFAIAIVLSLSIFPSCKATTTAATSVASTVAETTAASGKTVLNIVTESYHEEYLKVFAEKFKVKYPNIEPNIIVYDFLTVAEKQLMELSLPKGQFDIITTVPSWFSQYVAGDLIEPLDDYISDPNLTDPKEFDLKDFIPSVLDAATWNGKIYGLSMSLFPQVLFYREDLLKKYNIEVPKTLDEYLVAVKKLTIDSNNDGKIDIYGNIYNGTKGGVGAVGWNWFAYLFTFGGEILNDKGEPVVNSPEAVKALEYYVELSKYAPPEAINYQWEQMLEPVQEGRIAFCLTDFDGWRAFTGLKNFPIKVAPIPAGPDGRGHPLLGNWSEHIAKNSEHKKEAWEWLKFITSKEAMPVYLQYGEIPSRISSIQNKELLAKYPDMAIAYEDMQYGKGLPKHVEYGKIEDTTVLAVVEALAGSKTPKEALDEAQSAIEKIVQK